MVSDGYYQSDPARVENFKLRSDSQHKVNTRLKEIAKELSELPRTPPSIDDWIASWPDLDQKGFGIDTYEKHIKINKEYTKLVDDAESNLREMKILFIEDLIDKINSTLNKSD